LWVERDNGTTWDRFGPLTAFTDPAPVSFAWHNQTSSSVTATTDTTHGGEILTTGAVNSVNIRGRDIATPTTPYTITAIFRTTMMPQSGDSLRFGLYWRDSGGTPKLVTATFQFSSSNTYIGADFDWTSATVFGSNGFAQPLVAGSAIFTSSLVFLRVTDNGTNRIIYWSNDGVDWIQTSSGSRTSWLTPTRVGYWLDCFSSSGLPCSVWLVSWKQT
jgi:hypothetical protein